MTISCIPLTPARYNLSCCHLENLWMFVTSKLCANVYEYIYIHVCSLIDPCDVGSNLIMASLQSEEPALVVLFEQFSLQFCR